MTKRPFDLIGIEASMTELYGHQKRPKLLLYTLDKEIAIRNHFSTQLIPNDKKIVYTNWSFFINSQYFDGLLDSTIKDEITRSVNIEFLNSIETCCYIEILVNGFADWKLVPPGSLISIYRQLDFHLIIDILPSLKKEILSRHFTLRFYEVNRDCKIIDTPAVAQMYIKHVINSDKLYVLPDDDELAKIVFTELGKFDLHTIWSVIRLFPNEMVIKYLDYCVIKFDPVNFQSCINEFHEDPNLMVFIKRMAICMV